MSIHEILKSAQTIAVIGLSSTSYRTSNHIAEYLNNAGYNIIPVNPNEDAVFGLKSYPAMADLPDDVNIDVVNIFRNSQYTADMVKEIIEWSEKTGQKPVIWTQIGVSSDEAKNLAKENGFDYIEDKCMMVEHRKAS